MYFRNKLNKTSHVYDGPRIKLPNPNSKDHKDCGLLHRQRSNTSSSSPSSTRPRLASVLSATLSFLTSSSSSGSCSSKSRFSSGSTSESQENIHLLPVNCPQWMRDKLFAMNSIEIRSELGRGHYGVVYHAHVVDGSARWPVALKCAKTRDEQNQGGEDIDDEQVQGVTDELSAHEELVKEGEVMAALPYHENIANLQGLALDKSGRDPRIFLMIEYCGNKSMYRYLLANRVHFANELRRCKYQRNGNECGNADRGINLLVAWGYQIARGMEFLSQRSIVHGDLATRNVLLTDDLTAKISDFGLSHRLDGRQKSARLRQTHLPERWMAPEAIVHRRITTECDVWSYGILLWELFSLGQLPYKDLLVDSSVGFLDALYSGVRPPCPDFCPSEVYEVMTSCWTIDPHDRRYFSEISAKLTGFLDPGYTHRYQEAREEMLRRYSRIQQNRMYFNGANTEAERKNGTLPRQSTTGQTDGYCVMAAPGTTADTLFSVIEESKGEKSTTKADGYCVMAGVS